MPDVYKYYKAAILDQTKFWWSPTDEKIWAQMETHSRPRTS